MTAWTSDELTRIGVAEEMQIVSLRDDGTPGRPRTSAYRARYRWYSAAIIDRITSPAARSTTIRLAPR